MVMADSNLLQQLVTEIKKKPKYARVSEDIIRRIGEQQLQKRSSMKETIKATLSKLHQIGGAFLEHQPDFNEWSNELKDLPSDPHVPETQEFCLKKMKEHASTNERLPYLTDFYQTCLKPISPVQSILDLGCGIHPLAIPWMPLSSDPMYLGMDIFEDMTDFDRRFLQHIHLRGQVLCKDFLGALPRQKFQLALALKIIPLVDQISRPLTRPWLESIPASHILLTFPKFSLGLKNKGMPDHYSERLDQLITGSNWKVESFEFPAELTFLLHR